MLVLTRKAGESLVINGNIEVTLLQVHGNRVSIGVHAHPKIRIVRSEVFALDHLSFMEHPMAERDSETRHG